MWWGWVGWTNSWVPNFDWKFWTQASLVNYFKLYLLHCFFYLLKSTFIWEVWFLKVLFLWIFLKKLLLPSFFKEFNSLKSRFRFLSAIIIKLFHIKLTRARCLLFPGLFPQIMQLVTIYSQPFLWSPVYTVGSRKAK